MFFPRAGIFEKREEEALAQGWVKEKRMQGGQGAKKKLGSKVWSSDANRERFKNSQVGGHYFLNMS